MQTSFWKTGFLLIASALLISGCGSEGGDDTNGTIVTPDTTAPVIVLSGNSTMTVAQGNTFTDPGATATDNVDATVTVTATGTVNTAADGTYMITYTAADAAGNTATAKTRTVTVTDSVPVATDDTFELDENRPYQNTLSTNDTTSLDIGNTWGIVDAPAHGGLTLNNNGTFQYTPHTDYSGADSFTYQITDSDGTGNTATVSLTVHSPFVIKVQTDNSGVSNDDEFKIITDQSGSYTYNYRVDCDNNGTDETSDQRTDYTCHFSSAGAHTISIRGKFPKIHFQNTPSAGGATSDALKLMEIQQWGSRKWLSWDNAFHGCSLLKITATDLPDLSEVNSMSYAFKDIDEIESNIQNWQTGNVQNMHGLFQSLGNFNQDISGWDVSHVTDMSNMFAKASQFNQDLSSWDVSSVIDMSGMFSNAGSFDMSLTWNTGNVTDMSNMFHGAISLDQDLNFDTHNVLTMSQMFEDATNFDGDISGWNTGHVTTMYAMFKSARNFSCDIGGWDTSHVTDMGYMLYNDTAFNESLGEWNIQNVTTMQGMLEGGTLTVANYDATLTGWAAQSVQPNVPFHGGGSKYSDTGEIGRTTLTGAPHNWTITDGEHE